MQLPRSNKKNLKPSKFFLYLIYSYPLLMAENNRKSINTKMNDKQSDIINLQQTRLTVVNFSYKVQRLDCKEIFK